MPRHSLATRWASALFAAVFLWAAGPDAYGLHECPEHAAIPHVAALESGEHAGTRHVAPGAVSTADAPHSDGPCTCVRDCQITGEPPPPTVGATVQEDAPPARGVLAPEIDPRVLGARHAPFELHLPNAPPLTG